MGDLVDNFINVAAGFMSNKIQKKIKKKTKKTKGENSLRGESKMSSLLINLEEGKESSLLKSQISNRKTERRSGVLAINDIEKTLVKETIAVMKMKEKFNELNL